MKRSILSATLGIWLTLVTILPANMMFASTVGNEIQSKTPDIQCGIKLPKPATPPVPCAKPDDVSWNS